MLTAIHPKLPMRDKNITRDFYLNKLGFSDIGAEDYKEYLMVKKDNVEIHFFEFKTLDPKENDGQTYIRTDDIKGWFAFVKDKVKCSPPEHKPWRQYEFTILDPDNNALTFGQQI